MPINCNNLMTVFVDYNSLVFHHEVITTQPNVVLDSRLSESTVFDQLMKRARFPYRREELIGWTVEKEGSLDSSAVDHHTRRGFIVVHKGEMFKVLIMHPTNIHYHWLLGNYYGYPECCINDHIQKLDVFHKTHDKTPFKKQKETYSKLDLPPGGPMWCDACVSNFGRDLLERIKQHRLSSSPLFQESPSLTSYLAALNHWLEEDITPWNPHK